MFSSTDVVYSLPFWTQLSSPGTALSEIVSNQPNRCDLWAEEALLVLEKLGYKDVYKRERVLDMSTNKWLWETRKVWQHQFLSSITAEGTTFIADGTAGQFFDLPSQYSNGFYGFITDAPQILKEVYNYDGWTGQFVDRN